MSLKHLFKVMNFTILFSFININLKGQLAFKKIKLIIKTDSLFQIQKIKIILQRFFTLLNPV